MSTGRSRKNGRLDTNGMNQVEGSRFLWRAYLAGPLEKVVLDGELGSER